MPPKKAVKEEKILLGRPGNSLKSGIVRNRMLIYYKQ
jgi:obg-like ATPase 1